MKIHGYLVNRLSQKWDTNIGPISLSCPEMEMLGMMPVFKTKEAAQMYYDPDVGFIEVAWEDGNDHPKDGPELL